MDSNLLKEAIADAKAVRQTALANAKVALEEAFSERYQAMFAEKLKEEAAQDEIETTPSVEDGGDDFQSDAISNEEIDELIKELESEVGNEPAADATAEPDLSGGVPPASSAAVPPTVPPATGPVPQGCPPVPPAATGVPSVPPAIPTPDASGVPPTVPPAPTGEIPPSSVETPPSEVPTEEEEMDEDIDLNALLENLKEEIENDEDGDVEVEDIAESKKLASSGIGGNKAGGSANKKPSAVANSSSNIESGGGDEDGMPNVDQPKVVAKEATVASRPNQSKNATKDNLSTPSLGKSNGKGGQTEDGMPKLDQAKDIAKDPTEASRPNQSKSANKDNLSTPGGTLEENKNLKRQLAEATEVIKYVKEQLNEVNLLNAKLLYTNKLFKEYNMNNEQKMRIVEMFDLAKNVREVKLTFANIAESLNFSGSEIKKKVKVSPTAQSITEGLASGAVGSTKPSRQIISEGTANHMVSKFQKLAGIKMPSKK